jgi:class 3 adenylate cyclase/tetratricopeptide (TPR) repeat protein
MSDLSRWLEDQGLGGLNATLAANGVDLDVLAELTEQDLSTIGISLGDRKRLLRAVRDRLTEHSVEPPSNTMRPPDLPPKRTSLVDDIRPAKLPADEGDVERRHLTVMFCDLVESTKMAEELDAEEVSDALRMYHDHARSAVQSFGGQIAQFLGDGVLAYFGYPVAHEDDAERAVQAGLQLIRKLREDEGRRSRPITARVGIAAGPVVMHEMQKLEGWNSDSAVGLTINLAARIQGEAQPHSVIVDGSVQRLLGAAFVMTPLGSRTLKGIGHPVELWRVDARAAITSRFDATRHRHQGEMVGRADELRTLRRRWDEAVASQGNAVVITAEAGIGKSRLLYELRGSLGTHQELYAQCVSYSNATPYLPVTEGLRRFAGLADGEDVDARRARFETLLTTLGLDDPRLQGGLRHVMGLTRPDEEILTVSPEVRQSRTFEGLRSLFLALSREEPLLLIVEDLHWCDRATEALLATLVDALSESRILFVSTHRPEHAVPWLGRSGVLQLSLAALGKSESRQLLARLTEGIGVDDALLAAIAERAQGNPLFLEELSLSTKLQGSAGELPDTVQTLLMSRIDGLPKNLRRALQTASVLGREFQRKIFQAVWEQTDRLEELILELERMQLIQERLEHDESLLAFRHALIQDAAYGTLVRSRRRALHVSAAQAIERLSAAQGDLAAVLAHHYAGAELPREAIGFLLKLADRAMAAYALPDAETNLRKALALIDRIEEVDRRADERWRVKVRLAQVLYMRGRFQDSIDLLESDLQALEAGDSPALTAPCLFWLAHMYVRRTRYEDAERAATTAISQAQRIDDSVTRGKALGVLCLRGCLRGDSQSAEVAGKSSLDLLQKEGPSYWLSMTRFYMGMLQIQTGRLEEAAQEGLRVVDIGKALGDPRLQCYGAFLRSWALADAQDVSAVAQAERAVALAPDPTSLAYASGFLGYAMLRAGQTREAREELQRAVVAIAQIGFRPFESLFLAYLSEAERELGEVDRARSTAQRAIEVAETWSYPLGEAWARRALARAETQHADGAPDLAGAAQEIFRRIGAVHESC